jgi:integral membrane protein (TIGR01906 family)
MDAAAGSSNLEVAQPRSRVLIDGLTMAGTALIIIAVALVPLLTSVIMHPVLDAAQSAAWLGTDAAMAHALSDRTVDELLFGPATFAIPGPTGAAFYDPAEIAHLRDARTLLWLLFGSATIALLALCVALVRSSRPARIVRAVGVGGAATAIGVVIIGIVGLVAFEPLFELFHRIFFPGGNWAFDPRTERLVQLYPYAFWQVIAAALGVVAAILGLVVWLVTRLILGPDPDLGAS